MEVMMALSELEHDLDNAIYKTLPMALQYQRQQIVTYLQIFSSQVGCLYDAFEARNSSASRIFIENVERKKFVVFMTEFIETLQKLVRSEKTVWMVQMTYKIAKSKIKSYDYNSLFAELYLSFMKVRELLLKIDIEAEIELLNEIHYTIAKSVWKLKTGQWPEMAKFVDNFFRNTYGARQFWVRLGTSTDKIMICHSL